MKFVYIKSNHPDKLLPFLKKKKKEIVFIRRGIQFKWVSMSDFFIWVW